MSTIDLVKNYVFGLRDPHQMVVIEKEAYEDAKKNGTKEIPCIYLKEEKDNSNQYFWCMNEYVNEVLIENVVEDSVLKFEKNNKQLFKLK